MKPRILRLQCLLMVALYYYYCSYSQRGPGGPVPLVSCAAIGTVEEAGELGDPTPHRRIEKSLAAATTSTSASHLQGSSQPAPVSPRRPREQGEQQLERSSGRFQSHGDARGGRQPASLRTQPQPHWQPRTTTAQGGGIPSAYSYYFNYYNFNYPAAAAKQHDGQSRQSMTYEQHAGPVYSAESTAYTYTRGGEQQKPPRPVPPSSPRSHDRGSYRESAISSDWADVTATPDTNALQNRRVLKPHAASNLAGRITSSSRARARGPNMNRYSDRIVGPAYFQELEAHRRRCPPAHSTSHRNPSNGPDANKWETEAELGDSIGHDYGYGRYGGGEDDAETQPTSATTEPTEEPTEEDRAFNCLLDLPYYGCCDFFKPRRGRHNNETEAGTPSGPEDAACADSSDDVDDEFNTCDAHLIIGTDEFCYCDSRCYLLGDCCDGIDANMCFPGIIIMCTACIHE